MRRQPDHAAVRTLLVVSLMLAGCVTTYPLGMSEAEWKRLSPAQQLAAREKQIEIDRLRAIQRAEEKHRRAIERVFEEERLAGVYRRGRYGTIIECRLAGGEARFGSKWRPQKTQAFRLAIGEAKKLTVHRADGKRNFTTLWVRLGNPATRIDICAWKPARSNANCQTIEAPPRDFGRGLSRSIDLPAKLRGAALHCQY